MKVKSRIKVVKPGHTYDVPMFENEKSVQRIQFIDKKFDEDENKLVTIKDGITNEALLEVLIDRTQTLNEKMACRENSLAITKMQEALMWFEARTVRRLAEDVEGTHAPAKGDSVPPKPRRRKKAK